MEVKSESEVLQSCPTLRDPMDCSLLGSSAHGIFQARVLEWAAIVFSGDCVYIFKKTKFIIKLSILTQRVFPAFALSMFVNTCSSSEKPDPG